MQLKNFLHLGQNVLTFRTLLHLGSFIQCLLHLGLLHSLSIHPINIKTSRFCKSRFPLFGPRGSRVVYLIINGFDPNLPRFEIVKCPQKSYFKNNHQAKVQCAIFCISVVQGADSRDLTVACT